MKHSANYAAYPIQGISVGRAIIALYVKNHVNYLLAARNAAYSVIIAETTALYEALFGTILGREQNYSERMSLTQNVKAIKKEFHLKIDEFEEGIAFKFHRNSPVYNEIFPHGVTPYKAAALPETKLKMELAESLAEKYKTDIGDRYSTELKNIRLKFETESTAQGMTNGELKNVIPDYEAKRLALDKQLLKNICTIILQNIDNPSVVESFFDEHLIFPKYAPKADTGAYILTVAPQTHIAADIRFTASDTLLLTNTGPVSLFYFGASTANDAVPSTVTEILPDEEKMVSAGALGAPAHTFLLFVNTSSTDAGEVEIMLV